MIDGLKPYPVMKDPGVPWLGEVPEHWEVLPNRGVFDEVEERDQPEADMLSVTISRGVLRQEALLADFCKKDASNLDRSAYKLVKPGDLVYNKMRAWQGAVGVSKYEGIVSPAYVVQRPHGNIVPSYMHYLLRTPAFAKEAERWSYGLASDMWSLRPEHFRLIRTCLPPRPEQATIVSFLNYADWRMQRYIRAKQRLIKLLEEQKQAIIHKAVTRGLDPNVRLKPSGVEWLGDVPEHWEVMRLKWVSEGIQMGPFGASLTELKAYDTGFKLYGQENTISGDFSKGRRWITREQFAALQRYEILPGDLVLTRKGSIGKSKMIPMEASRGIADSDTIRVRLDRKQVSDRFVVLLLQDAAYVQRQIESIQRGAILAGLNTATTSNLRLAVPPISEQMMILAKVEADTAAVSHAIRGALREVDLFREYRTRLIADVVTGKLDVREVAARLPEEAGDTDSLQDFEAEPVDDEAATNSLEDALEAIEA